MAELYGQFGVVRDEGEDEVVCWIVEKNARLYPLHYGAVPVDEFQDMSPQQLEIALASSSTSRTFGGAPLQGIFSWAGARPAEVERELGESAASHSGSLAFTGLPLPCSTS
ncbi:UvrD-helicase domain-containing protein [Streptomyces sp. NBC_01233]|uniref:UvrD-helicase domain-containing protein n=1 Tax=Streptomyces sp. NBC_01233 TaxID=2903787 RepID=UPI002E0E3610|nr:hypothetical protein OG332_42480 [Streptomyces sp. NBC_01233]